MDRFLLLVTTHLTGDLLAFYLSGHSVKVMQCPNALELGKKITIGLGRAVHTERCLNQLSYLQVVELMGGLTSKPGELLKAKSPGAGVRGAY